MVGWADQETWDRSEKSISLLFASWICPSSLDTSLKNKGDMLLDDLHCTYTLYITCTRCHNPPASVMPQLFPHSALIHFPPSSKVVLVGEGQEDEAFVLLFLCCHFVFIISRIWKHPQCGLFTGLNLVTKYVTASHGIFQKEKSQVSPKPDSWWRRMLWQIKVWPSLNIYRT